MGVLVLLILTGGMAAGIFFLGSNVNQYRTPLASFLSKKLGCQVTMKNLSLSWRGGIGIEAKGVEFRKEAQSAAPFFVSESLLVDLDALNLLRARAVVSLKTRDGELDSGAWQKTKGWAFRMRGIRTEIEKTLPDGRLHLKGVGRVLEGAEPDLAWEIEQGLRETLRFQIRFQQEKLLVRGEAGMNQEPLWFRCEGRASSLNLEDVLKALGIEKKGRAVATGKADGWLQIQGTGKREEEIEQSLAGKGSLEIQGGTLLDFNLVSTLLRRLTVIPGLEEIFKEAAPRAFQQEFTDSTTSFEDLGTDFIIQGNQIEFQSLILKGSQYLIEAEGTYDLERNMNFRARLILLEELSQFMMRRVKELGLLANAQGRITIPFVYRGVWPGAQPRPDLGFVAQRFVQKTGVELLKGLEEALSGGRNQK